MAHQRRFAAAALLLIAFQAPALAQDIPSMLVRVSSDDDPTADVDVVVVGDGSRRRVATTGASGLAVVEFGRVPLRAGTNLIAVAVTCGERTDLLLARTQAALPSSASDCRRVRIGAVVWYRTDRLDVSLGSTPRGAARTITPIIRATRGPRLQIGPTVAVLAGDDLGNIGVGIGGELVAGYDARGAFGVGAGLGVHRHTLDGVDEGLWRWSVLAEPRYTFRRPHWTATPYLAARVGWQSLDADAGAGLLTESGWSFGAGGGVVFPLWFGTFMDVSAHLARLSVGAEGFDRSGMLFDLTGAIRF